jgi:phosphatidylglycerophosphate synthase
MTAARIAVAPVIALLMLLPVWQLRLGGWLLYIAAAVTDYYDGKLARSRNLVTDLGRLLDPLADKALLVFTLLPMYWMQRGIGLFAPLPAADGWANGTIVGPVFAEHGGFVSMPFVTPFGVVGLPWWIVAIVLGRELFMTGFRQAAARRGVIISAIGPAKWKTGFQLTWVGAAFFWFFAALAAVKHAWTSPLWRAFAMFNGIVGTISMLGAVALTIYSMVLYVQRYGSVFTARQPSR